MRPPSRHRPRSRGAIILLALLLPVAPCVLRAQLLPFQQLTVRHGLTSNYITALAQGARGRLWIGTADGITVYDGDRCEMITRGDGLPGNYITQLSRRPDGGMYAVAGGRAVAIADDGTVRSLSFHGRAPAPPVADLATGADGAVYAIATDGLWRIARDSATAIPGTRRLGGAHCLRSDAAGRLWLLDASRVTIFDLATRSIRCADSLPGAYVNSYGIHEGRAGQMLVCTRDSGVTEFRDGRVLLRHRFPDAQPQALLRDEEGTWWIGTTCGLYSVRGTEFSPRHAVFHDFRDNDSGIEINVLLLDREHNIWYGSAGMGVGWLEDRATQYFPARDMTGTGVQDSRGRLWLGSHLGIWECWRLDDGRWRRRLHARGARWPSGYSYHLQAIADLTLIVSFSGHAIAAFDIARPSSPTAGLRLARVLAPSDALPVPDSFCFLVDRSRQLWMKTRAGDVAIATLTTPPRLRRLLSRPHPDIRVFFEDEDGSVWIGGYDAPPVVCAAPDPAAAIPRRRDDLGRRSIRALLRSAGRLWIGSMTGLLAHDGDRWDVVDSDDGLPNERIFALASGRDGTLWLGTQTGVIAYEPRTQRINPRFDLSDSPVGACGMLEDGTLWLATAFGLTLHDENRSVTDRHAPRPFLRAMHVNDRPVPFADGLTLKAIENNLRFEFSVPHLRSSRPVRLEYRLEGRDSSWSAPIGERSIHFRALPPGDYDLRVRARNSAGITATPLMLRFRIRPPLWAEWWFIAAVSMLLLGAATTAVWLRWRRRAETERMRARIAADLHDDIGTGLTRIAMMSDMMQQQAGMIRADRGDRDELHAALAATLRRTGAIARELIENMSDVVWSLDPRNEGVLPMAERLRVFAYDLTEAREIALRFEIDDSLRRARTGAEVSRSVLMVMKEALTNAVRHATPAALHVRLLISEYHLHFSIEDDGAGFDPATTIRRSGLRHMEERIASCGGSLTVRSRPGGGTVITGSAPLRMKN